MSAPVAVGITDYGKTSTVVVENPTKYNVFDHLPTFKTSNQDKRFPFLHPSYNSGKSFLSESFNHETK